MLTVGIWSSVLANNFYRWFAARYWSRWEYSAEANEQNDHWTKKSNCPLIDCYWSYITKLLVWLPSFAIVRVRFSAATPFCDPLGSKIGFRRLAGNCILHCHVVTVYHSKLAYIPFQGQTQTIVYIGDIKLVNIIIGEKIIWSTKLN